jgi:hypothetical protein
MGPGWGDQWRQPFDQFALFHQDVGGAVAPGDFELQRELPVAALLESFARKRRPGKGFLRSVLSLMDVDLESPDHTTLSRRSRSLNVHLHRVAGDNAIHLIVDSTGLSIVGEGEGDRTYKLGSGTTSEPGRYVKSLGEPRGVSGMPRDRCK